MLNGRLMKRKWGWYLTLLKRNYFKVKLLWFRNGGECSMQKHHHRHELWLFLSGFGWMHGEVNNGKGTIPDQRTGEPIGCLSTSGDYRRVPMGQTHQFKASSRCLVLEIQYGDKCEEEDIVRL